MALAIGHVYSNLQKFLADVERHEEESNGAFEVQTNETSDGTVITCFCSGALDTSGVASCPATLKALDQKTNGVKVLELFLEHSHPGASGTATKHAAVTDADVDITDDLMEKMLEAPRYFRSAELKLDEYVLHISNRRICPYCPNFQTGIASNMEVHLRRIHQEAALHSNDVFFIPCYTQCHGIRSSRKTAHMHCCCGETFSNDKHFENHRQYNCTAEAADGNADVELEEMDEEDISTNQTTSGRRQRRSAARFSSFLNKVKRSGVIEDDSFERPTAARGRASRGRGRGRGSASNTPRVNEDEFEEVPVPTPVSARGGRGRVRRGVGRPASKFQKLTETEQEDEMLFGSAQDSSTADVDLEEGEISHLEPVGVDTVYDPTFRNFIENPSEPWVQEVQHELWSMDTEQVGYARSIDELEGAIAKYFDLTGTSFYLEREENAFGKEIIPSSSKGYRILWEGIMNEKQIILQDGIPFVIVASRVYRCAVNAEEESVKAPCMARLFVKEVLKYPQYRISRIINMEKATVLLSNAMSSGVAQPERRFYAIFSKLADHEHDKNADLASMHDPGFEADGIDWRGLSLTCEHCYAQFLDQEQLILHLQSAHGFQAKGRECEVCGQQFIKLATLKNHQRTRHPEHFAAISDRARTFYEVNFRCALCFRPCYCAGIKQLVNHYVNEHGATCPIERIEFSSIEDFSVWKGDQENRDGVRYIQWGSSKIRPDQVDTYFVCAWNYETAKHMIAEDDPGRCCAYIHMRRDTLMGIVVAEYSLHHIGHRTITPESQALPEDHQREILDRAQAAELQTEGAPKDFQCGTCVPRKKFPASSALHFHLKSSHKNCHFCGEEMRGSEHSGSWHMAVNHPELYLLSPHEQQLKCGECSQDAGNRRQLISHYAAQHQQPAEIQLKVFNTVKSFITWKRAVFGSCLHAESRALGDGPVRLICRGWYQQASEENMKTLTNRPRCPSFLNFYVNRDSKQVVAEFCTFHASHVDTGEEVPEELLQPHTIMYQDETLEDDDEPLQVDFSAPNVDKKLLQVKGSFAMSEAGTRLAAQLSEDVERYAERKRNLEMAERELWTEVDELFRHVERQAGYVGDQADAGDPLTCSDCHERFETEEECRQHARKEHTSTKCRYCNAKFSRYQDVAHHQRVAHPTQVHSAPFGLLCSMCGQKLEAYDDLAYHLKDFHEITECIVEYTVFENAADFYRWKAEVEIRNNSYFVRKRRIPNQNEVTLLFTCMAGIKGASKFRERQCPAFMKAVIPRSSPNVSVTFCLYHLGHETSEVQFWGQVKKSIHGFRTFKHINRLRKIRELGQENQLEVGEGEDWTQVRYEEEVATTNEDSTDLDVMMKLYWDILQEKLSKSGNYVLGLSGAAEAQEQSQGGEAIEGERICHVCQLAFKNRRSMLRHLRRMHDPEWVFKKGPRSKYSRPVRCLFCNMPMSPPAMKNLIQHYVNAHQQQIQMKIRMFRNEMDFSIWKEAVSGNVFRRNKWYATQQGERRFYYTCKFSGHLQNPPAGVTEGHCPAWIFAQELSNGNIQVTYCLYHIGHELNPDGTATDVPPRYPLGKTAGDRFTYGAKWSKFIPEYVIGPEDEAGTALLALENTLGPPHAQEYVMEMTQEVDGVIVEGEVQMHQTMVEEEDTEAEVDGEWAVEMDVQEITPEEAAVQEAAARQPPMVTPGGPLPGAGVDETAGLRSQINVLVRSVDGTEREVRLSLTDFPLVEKEGKKFYALDEAALIEAVGQVMAKQGLTLYEGDQLEILQ